MSKSILYAANTAEQATTAAGTIVNFGQIVRRYGCHCTLSGGNATIKGSGYYDADVNLTFTAGAAGTATVTLYKDGVEVPGATQSTTVADGNTYGLTMDGIIRQGCDCEDVVTIVISGVAATVTNAAIIIEKL